MECKLNWDARIFPCLPVSRVGIPLYVKEKWEIWLAARLQIRAEMLLAAVLMVNIHEPKYASFRI